MKVRQFMEYLCGVRLITSEACEHYVADEYQQGGEFGNTIL